MGALSLPVPERAPKPVHRLINFHATQNCLERLDGLVELGRLLRVVEQVLDAEPKPPRVIDPRTSTAYVLVPADAYERLKTLLYDESAWTEDEKLELLAESGSRAGWDAPEMDDYDNYDEARKTYAVDAGQYEVQVGASSSDIRAKSVLTVGAQQR